MPEQDPYASIAKPLDDDPYAAIAKAPTATPPAAQPSLLQRVGGFGKDVAKGLGESAVSLMSTGDHAVRKIPGIGEWLTTPITGTPADQAIAHTDQLAKPANTTQTVSKGIGDAAQFLIPGGAEEKAASMLPAVARPLGKIALSALSAGGVNKAQGGEFGTGALAGAGGQVIGQGLKAIAPTLAETALKIPKAMRAFGKTPGAALLDETSGIRPETIAASARDRLGQLNPQLEAAADAASTRPNAARGGAGQSNGVLLRPPSTAGGPVPSMLPNRIASLGPARSVIGNEMGNAANQNAEGLHNQLGRMQEFLGNRFGTGEEIPANVTPRDLLDLKRGFNEEHLRWNPEMHDRALSTGRRAYGALDSELDRTVPEAAGLNQRISSLIPIAQRAESVSRDAPVLQRAAGRVGAHTGALTMGLGGAYAGRREGGTPGMIAGGLTGLIAPELIASPEGQVALARMLYKSNGLRPLVGAGLQADRGNK